MRIDHVIIGTTDLGAKAAELEAAHGLHFLLGGRHPGGTVNSVAPLEPPQYLELLAVDEVLDDIARDMKDAIDAGRTLLGWAVVPDDLDAVAARTGREIGQGSITMQDGTTGGWHYLEGPDDPAFPFFLVYDQDSEVRRRRWEERRREVGNEGFGAITFVEVGGDEAALREWIGGAGLPVRYAGGEPGLRAVGIAGPSGEIVLRQT
jgi:hypothetical protein